jgi:hypothetical protein
MALAQDCIEIKSSDEKFTRSDDGRYTVLRCGFKEYVIDHQPSYSLRYAIETDFQDPDLLKLCGIDSLREPQEHLIPVKEKFISMLQDGSITFENYNAEASPSLGFMMSPQASITDVYDFLVAEKSSGPELILMFRTLAEGKRNSLWNIVSGYEFAPDPAAPGGYRFVCCRFILDLL